MLNHFAKIHPKEPSAKLSNDIDALIYGVIFTGQEILTNPEILKRVNEYEKSKPGEYNLPVGEARRRVIEATVDSLTKKGFLKLLESTWLQRTVEKI